MTHSRYRWQTGLTTWVTTHSGRKGLTPENCPLTSTRTQWFVPKYLLSLPMNTLHTQIINKCFFLKNVVLDTTWKTKTFFLLSFPLSYHFKKKANLNMYLTSVWLLWPAWVCVHHIHQKSVETRRRHWISWTRRYRLLWASMWVLGTQHRFSWKAPNWRAIFTPPEFWDRVSFHGPDSLEFMVPLH